MKDIAPPVLLFIYVWTAYYTSILSKILINNYAPINLILSTVLFRNCNSLFTLFFTFSVHDLTQVQIKATAV